MSEMICPSALLRDLHEFLKPLRHGFQGDPGPMIHTACKKIVAGIAVSEEFERQANALFLQSLEPVKQPRFGGRLHISRANHKAMNHILPLGPAQDASKFGPNIVAVDFRAAKLVAAPVMPDGGSAA